MKQQTQFPGWGPPPTPVNQAPEKPYSDGKRAFYGLYWSGWTALLVIAGFTLLVTGPVLSGLLGLVLGGITGRYAWHIWTWQARHLWFLFFI